MYIKVWGRFDRTWRRYIASATQMDVYVRSFGSTYMYSVRPPDKVLLRKGFRDTNNLIIDIFLKQKRNLTNTVVS